MTMRDSEAGKGFWLFGRGAKEVEDEEGPASIEEDMPEKRYCTVCGEPLSDMDEQKIRVCEGKEGKECGLMYKGEQAGIGEGEESLASVIMSIKNRMLGGVF